MQRVHPLSSRHTPWKSPITLRDSTKLVCFSPSMDGAAGRKIMSHLLAFLHRCCAFD
jgi:hypothetical protein